MKVAPSAKSHEITKLDNPKSAKSVLRLRLLVQDLLNEVDSLNEHSLGFSETSHNPDGIDFYEEVARFESALIRRALRRTKGHQLNAARLLNLRPSTLNAKIKQYQIEQPLYHDD